jgi:SAM-dependent methyltransferase
MLSKNLYDLNVSADDKFDLVIFAGVLYHLRFPFLGLKRIADALRPGGKLIIETGLLLSHSSHPFIYAPRPEDSPFDTTSVTFFNHLALVAGLETLGFTDIRCRNILAWGAEPVSYPGWEEFVHGAHSAIAESYDIVVGRATYTCQLREGLERATDGELQSYWYGEHSLNSSRLLGEEFLDSYR